MVKIGRAPKNYGLTKVQARRAEKERDARRFANNISQEESTEARGDMHTATCTVQGDHLENSLPLKQDRILSVEIGQGEPRQRQGEFGDKPGNSEAGNVPGTCAFSKRTFAVSYPETLERCIAEAQRIISKFTQAHNKGKRQNSSNAARQKYVDYLKATLNMLSDCRYAKLMTIIDGERRSKAKKSPPLYTVRKDSDVDQRWADNMAQNIAIAVRRLVKDLPWLATKDIARTSKDHSPTPPLLLRVSRPAVIGNSSDQKPKKFGATTHPCMRTTHQYLLDFSGVSDKEEPQEQDQDESPRERLQLKIKQYVCDSEVVGDNSKSEELAIIVVNAAAAVQKKSRREAYDSMGRSERRNTLRLELMMKLNAVQILPVLLRYIRALLRLKEYDCAMYPSSEMVDVIVATMAQNEKLHVFLFVKNIAAEFLGPDKDAFFARHEYYLFWSAVVKAAKMKLEQRWKIFASSFSCDPAELGKLSSDARRLGRLTAEHLLPKLSSLVRCPHNQAKRKDTVEILQRYWSGIHLCFYKYGRIMTHLVSMQYIRLAQNGGKPSDNPQLSLLFSLIGIQHFETELLAAVDNLSQRFRRRSPPEQSHCLAAVKDLLSKIICRETRRVLIVTRGALCECISDKDAKLQKIETRSSG